MRLKCCLSMLIVLLVVLAPMISYARAEGEEKTKIENMLYALERGLERVKSLLDAWGIPDDSKARGMIDQVEELIDNAKTSINVGDYRTAREYITNAFRLLGDIISEARSEREHMVRLRFVYVCKVEMHEGMLEHFNRLIERLEERGVEITVNVSELLDTIASKIKEAKRLALEMRYTEVEELLNETRGLIVNLRNLMENVRQNNTRIKAVKVLENAGKGIDIAITKIQEAITRIEERIPEDLAEPIIARLNATIEHLESIKENITAHIEEAIKVKQRAEELVLIAKRILENKREWVEDVKSKIGLIEDKVLPKIEKLNETIVKLRIRLKVVETPRVKTLLEVYINDLEVLMESFINITVSVAEGAAEEAIETLNGLENRMLLTLENVANVIRELKGFGISVADIEESKELIEELKDELHELIDYVGKIRKKIEITEEEERVSVEVETRLSELKTRLEQAIQGIIRLKEKIRLPHIKDRVDELVDECTSIKERLKVEISKEEAEELKFKLELLVDKCDRLIVELRLTIDVSSLEELKEVLTNILDYVESIVEGEGS